MEITYKTFTVQDIHDWLEDNKQNGLSERVMTRVRANSIIHSPYVKPDDVIIVTAWDVDKLVGYTAMFPEHWVKPDLWVENTTTMFVEPAYRGEFISFFMVKKLHECARGYVLGSDSVLASDKIDKLLGSTITYIPRSLFVFYRKIKVRSLRSLCSWLLEKNRILHQKINIRRFFAQELHSKQWEYCDEIDAATYKFILDHSHDDICIRSREMLNWIIRYPFVVNAPIPSSDAKNEFDGQVEYSQTVLVKVFDNNNLIGFFVLRVYPSWTRVLLLYTLPSMQERVFELILQHVLVMNLNNLSSVYSDLNDYISKRRVYLKSYAQKFSFTHPREMLLGENRKVQGSFGDMFA